MHTVQMSYIVLYVCKLLGIFHMISASNYRIPSLGLVEDGADKK